MKIPAKPINDKEIKKLRERAISSLCTYQAHVAKVSVRADLLRDLCDCLLAFMYLPESIEKKEVHDDGLEDRSDEP